MIKPISLLQLASLLNAKLIGDDASFEAVSIDSRTLERGQLFIAISGKNFDGHDYVASAEDKGACAAIVEKQLAGISIPQLIVANARLALGQLGELNRQAFQGKIVAITGSSGKTTVKEFVASILSNEGKVLATQGNLNNELGVPLTLLQLSQEHQFAVIEMGASAVGEIEYSVALVRPQVAVLTNASNAHVGKFGGLNNIIEAKGEIIDGLAEDGIVVLNLDDPSFYIWQNRAKPKKNNKFCKTE